MCTVYSRENSTAEQYLFQNDWKFKTVVNVCLATHLNLVFEWKSKITNKTNRPPQKQKQTLKQKQTHLQTSAASCRVEVFTIMRSQNGLDRSRDQVNLQHGGSIAVVEYDEFDDLHISEMGSIVKVPL